MIIPESSGVDSMTFPGLLEDTMSLILQELTLEEIFPIHVLLGSVAGVTREAEILGKILSTMSQSDPMIEGLLISEDFGGVS